MLTFLLVLLVAIVVYGVSAYYIFLNYLEVLFFTSRENLTWFGKALIFYITPVIWVLEKLEA